MLSGRVLAMPHDSGNEKQQAHELIDRLARTLWLANRIASQ
jgi:hypothetical protein